MLSIRAKKISYNSVETSLNVTHCILIAQQNGQNILLSHPNLFLYQKTRQSIRTSLRYASIISMFYRFLSTLEKMKGKELGVYHMLADNKDIVQWQVHRQTERVNKQSLRPSLDTTLEDAKILMVFFNWLNTRGYLTNVNVQLKTWQRNRNLERKSKRSDSRRRNCE